VRGGKRVDLRLNQVSVFINREGVFYGLIFTLAMIIVNL